jgi:hypothetical protein
MLPAEFADAMAFSHNARSITSENEYVKSRRFWHGAKNLLRSTLGWFYPSTAKNREAADGECEARKSGGRIDFRSANNFTSLAVRIVRAVFIFVFLARGGGRRDGQKQRCKAQLLYHV